jgi:hypothetical protein
MIKFVRFVNNESIAFFVDIGGWLWLFFVGMGNYCLCMVLVHYEQHTSVSVAFLHQQLDRHSC